MKQLVKNKEIDAKTVIFLLGYSIFLIRAIIGNTTFSEYISIYGINLYFILSAGISVLLVKIILYDKYNIKDLTMILIISLIFISSFKTTGYSEIIILLVLLIGSKNVEFEKIVKVHFIIYTIITIIAMVFALFGFIDNYAIYSTTRGYRYALGNTYATDFSAGIFYLFLDFAYIKRNKWRKLYSIIIFLIAFIVYQITDANSCFFFSTLLSIVTFFKWKKDIKENIIMRKIMSYSFLALSIFSFLIEKIYLTSHLSFLKKIDIWINYRLAYGAVAISKYGLTLFGRKIDFIGNGWGTVSHKYFYVDNGYLHLTLLYGILIMLVFCLGFMFAIRNNKKMIDNKTVILLLFIAISSLIEPRFFNIIYNAFIFIISINAFQIKKNKENKKIETI